MVTVGAEGVQNRVIAVGLLDAHPENYRQHPERQIAGIRASLRVFGQPRSIVVQELATENTEGAEKRYTIVAGHGVKLAAEAEGWAALRCDVLPADWPPQKIKAYLVADNELGRLADNDDAQLAALIEEARAYDDKLLAAMGYDAQELGELLKSIERAERAAQEDPGPQIDKAEELRVKWGVNSGDLWACGEHRIICGDCTDAAVVKAVAFGDAFDLVCTDPPYGVSYADKNEYLNAVAKGNRIQIPIEGDHLTVEEAADLWRKAFTLLFEHTKPGGVYYVNAPQGGDLMMMMMMLREVGWLLKPQIIWVKNNHVLGRSDYQLKHEPILYGWKPGSHFWCGSRSEMSVWMVDKPTNSDLHPTTKPLELIEKAVTNSSKPGEVVADFFSGSGTTLIACERLGRKCRAIEITPGYVAVALERWAVMTGKTPVLIEAKQEDV